MFTLDHRTCQILLFLLESEKPIPSREIAGEMKISPRQVQYALRQVDTWIDKRGLTVVRIPGIGITVDGPETQKINVIDELSKLIIRPDFYTPQSRTQSILLTLFFSDQPIIINKLVYELNASRSTVTRDLLPAKEWLQERNLQLISRPNYGLRIDGDEIILRNAFVELLVCTVGEDYLLAWLQSPADINVLEIEMPKRFPQTITQQLINFYSNQFREFLVFFQKNGGKNISDNTYIRLAFTLNVSKYRIGKGFHIKSKTIEAVSDYSNKIAGALLEKYTLDNGHATYNFELNYLAQCIETLSRQWNLNEALPISVTVKISLRVISSAILNIISRRLHPSLMVNAELEDHLISILSEEFSMDQPDISRDERLYHQIDEEYPNIHSLTDFIREELEIKFHYCLSASAIDKLSLCLIAAVQDLHASENAKKVLIVCNSGTITAWVLESRIKNIFPDLEIVGKSSVLELPQWRGLSEVDFIISTVKLGRISIPYLVVNPLLEEEDIERIQNLISKDVKVDRQLLENRLAKKPKNDLRSLLTPDVIQLNIEAGNWMDAVDKAGAPLVKSKSVEKRFVTAMKNVIIENGPYMILWPGIALLHAHSTDGVNELSMSLTTFRNGVRFGHEKNDPVDIAVVIATADKASHYDAVNQLLDIFNKTDKLKTIRSAEQVSEILELITGA